MDIRTFLIPWTTIVVLSETAIFIPCTLWGDPHGIKDVSFLFDIAAEAGNMELSPAYQLCNGEDAPESAVQLGTTWHDTIGLKYPNGAFDVVSAMASRLKVRFGFLARNKSGQGTNPSMMRVGGKVMARI